MALHPHNTAYDKRRKVTLLITYCLMCIFIHFVDLPSLIELTKIQKLTLFMMLLGYEAQDIVSIFNFLTGSTAFPALAVCRWSVYLIAYEKITGNLAQIFDSCDYLNKAVSIIGTMLVTLIYVMMIDQFLWRLVNT